MIAQWALLTVLTLNTGGIEYYPEQSNTKDECLRRAYYIWNAFYKSGMDKLAKQTISCITKDEGLIIYCNPVMSCTWIPALGQNQ